MLIKKICFHFSRFAQCEEGNVFVMVALASMMIIASTGTAVDMARAQVLQVRIQSALDAAGLAAGSVATIPPSPLPGYCGSSTWVQCTAQKYFNANFPTGYLNSGTVTVTATIGGVNNSIVTLAANTSQATTFMKVVGINTVNVGANTQITRANSGMELVLVLDNTGSMTTVLPGDSLEKIQALKDSITGSGNLLDILYGTTSNTVPNFWIGLVPFGDMVNLGTEFPNFMDSAHDSALDFGPTIGGTCPTYSGTAGVRSTSPTRCSYTLSGASKPFFGLTNWVGCVNARANGLEETDQPPSSLVAGSYYQAYIYASTATGISSGKCTGGSNAWMCSKTSTVSGVTTTQTIYNSGSTTTDGNLDCTIAQVQPMVAERSTITTAVNAMQAGGNTAINLGAAWGYRMLSPNWAGMWGGEMNATGNVQYPVLPLAYNTPLMNKVMILMTDGMNNPPGGTAGTAYVGQSAPTVASLDTSTKTVCDNMKSHGIIIYTIGFGTTDDNDPSNPTSVNGPLLKYCATQLYSGDTSHYFLATGSISLNNAFSQIGASLANLRVSQ